MRRAAGPLSFTLFLSAAALAVPAEEARSLPTTSFAVSTERVKVDVVVRDKKDAILRGLTAADLEVYEDGVRQTVDSFDFVERNGLEPDVRETELREAVRDEVLGPGVGWVAGTPDPAGARSSD